MVDALRRMHRSLAPGGALLDMQPALADPWVVSGDGELGRIAGEGLQAVAAATDAALACAVDAGLFAFETEAYFSLVHRFDTPAELVEEVSAWRLQKLPPDVRAAALAARGPLDVVERCVLRRLRAL